MSDDPVEPPLRDVFVEQACEVFNDAYADASVDATHWEATKAAMSVLLDWLDSRRL